MVVLSWSSLRFARLLACLVLLACSPLRCAGTLSCLVDVVKQDYPFTCSCGSCQLGQPLCPWDWGNYSISFLLVGLGPPETLLQTLSRVISRRIRPRLAPRTSRSGYFPVVCLVLGLPPWFACRPGSLRVDLQHQRFAKFCWKCRK